MYLLFLLAAMGTAYVGFAVLFWFFFENKLPVFSHQSLYSLVGISIFMLGVYVVSYLVPDFALGNRILHLFGGGFLAYCTCALAVRDTNLRIDYVRFCILATLAVTTLGVGNELMEFVLQTSTGALFSPTPTDTWLDLASNTLGIASAAIMCRYTFRWLLRS